MSLSHSRDTDMGLFGCGFIQIILGLNLTLFHHMCSRWEKSVRVQTVISEEFEQQEAFTSNLVPALATKPE